MDSNKKIRNMISRIETNLDSVSNELTGLSAKVNCIFDDTTKMISGELLFSMYVGLMLQGEE